MRRRRLLLLGRLALAVYASLAIVRLVVSVAPDHGSGIYTVANSAWFMACLAVSGIATLVLLLIVQMERRERNRRKQHRL